jgi:hypothetical protein
MKLFGDCSQLGSSLEQFGHCLGGFLDGPLFSKTLKTQLGAMKLVE